MNRRRRLRGLVGVVALLTASCFTAAAPVGHAAVAATAEPSVSVIGHGKPAGCTSAAVVNAVAKGGHISFDCGTAPVTIVMKHTAKIVNTSHRVVIDGGGLVTLDGAGKRRILYMNTCDQKQIWTTSHCDDQRWPQLVVEDITLADGNASGPQSGNGVYGGGAMFVRGGRLSVSGSSFLRNRCHATGPDLGGAAIRALSQFHHQPVTVSHDVFRGGHCSNGGALSSIGVSWLIRHATMVDNRATGRGANPARSGAPGGGSGGAIYTDGDAYQVAIVHTVIRDNHANEGGGAVFFVSNDRTGKLYLRHSALRHNPSDGFFTAGYPGVFYLGAGKPHVRHSTLS